MPNDDLKRRAQAAKKKDTTESPASTPPELEQAKDLIRQKRYEDARALLLTIDHPTAEKLLERLKEAQVVKVFIRQPMRPATREEIAARNKPYDWRKRVAILALVVLVLVVAGMAYSAATLPVFWASNGLNAYCRHESKSDDCKAWTTQTMEQNRAIIMECQAEFSSNEYPILFESCLEKAGI